jgi:hypothetical protein
MTSNLILVKYKNLTAHISKEDFDRLHTRCFSKSKQERLELFNSVVTCLEEINKKVEKYEHINEKERKDTASDIAIYEALTNVSHYLDRGVLKYEH